MTQPQILSLNLEHEIVEFLEAKNYAIYEGGVGNPIKLNIRYDSYVNCLLQHKLPRNFHEYDIVIVDLTNEKIVDYEEENHKSTYNKTSTELAIRCYYPQNIFDPRPLSLSLIATKIGDFLKRESILMVFAAAEEEVEYNLYNSSRSYNDEKVKKSNYEFTHGILINSNKHGLKTKIASGENELFNFLRKNNDKFNYEVTFQHPHVYKDGKSTEDPNFRPLVYNDQNEIVGFLRRFASGSFLFVFPQVKEKKEFVGSFLDEIGPSFVPSIFPDNIKNSWKNNPRYYLPNQAELISQKAELTKNYNKALEKLDNEITKNTEAFGWLHAMLTEKDAELVGAVIKFLSWLGFTDVRDGDEANKGSIKEEDIQIETADGLIILEVKGLGGTSKDSECSQIGKVKARRVKQRKKFDVFASYIVNHQRHIAPQERQNPPFTDHQKDDALYDERGLITTWQLFNLYFLIEDGVLTKEQVRAQFYTYGFIDFIPQSFTLLGKPSELFKNNTVAILTLPLKIALSENEDVFIVHGEVYQKVKIKSIMVNDQKVNSAEGIEVGLMLSKPIGKSSFIYKIA